MFDFIIPFRSQTTTDQWEETCQLLEQTVRSACHSLDKRFRVFIVCHEIPSIELPAEKCHFLQVDFPSPCLASENESSHKKLIRFHSDKGRKILWGLNHVRQSHSRYFMVLDADDLVSQQLVGYCMEQNNENGYYLEKGYRTVLGDCKRLFIRNKFFHECGSSFVLRTNKAPFPEKLDFRLDYSDYFIRRYTNHAYVPECMESLGHLLSPVPFPGAVYRFHANNIYATKMRQPDNFFRTIARRILKGRRISAQLQDEFSIPE